MYLPPLQPSRNPNIYVSGDVTIDETAAIAAGAIFQALPGSRITIAAGVCVGMGSIVQAYQGTLTIEEGATLGAGVLMVGSGKIGANACIGSATTILNPAIAPRQLVAPGSVLGDESRQWPEIEAQELNPEASEPLPNSSPLSGEEATPAPSQPNSQPFGGMPRSQPAASNGAAPEPSPQPQADESSPTSQPLVSGQQHINRLLLTLFPHKKIIPNQPLEDD